MTELRRYPLGAISRLSEPLLQEIESGVMDRGQLERGMAEFQFRDAEGGYWTWGLRSQRWYRYSSGHWSPADAPAGDLEGPDALAELAPLATSTLPREEGGAPNAFPEDAVSGFKARVDGIREAYEAGRLNSSAVEQLAGEIFLIDKQRQLWTVGLRSGSWYRRGDGKWIFSRQGPAADSLLDTGAEDSQEAMEDAFMEFVMNEGDPLPEPVVDEWSPPAGLAEPIYECPACSKVDLGVVERCRFCGTDISARFPGPASSATRFCGHCGSPVSAGMIFCTQCGEKL